MSHPASEVALRLHAAHNGAAEALGQVLESCRMYLLRIAHGELDPELRAKGGASDVVQQTMLDAFRDFGRFEGNDEAELRAWLRRLLLNNLADFTRMYRETGKRQIDREVPLDVACSPNLVAEISSPSGQAMGREEEEAIGCALAKLPEDHRRVLEMRFQEDLTFDQIGQRLNLSPTAARKLWLRALKLLQQETEGLR